MCYREPRIFDFTPGLNAIIGPNDRGKSTLLAAVGWVLWGRPAGDTVRSWGAKKKAETVVELLFADGLTIARQRDHSGNKYCVKQLGNPKPTEFRAMGNSVPPEIQDLLSLQEINFQGQANNLYPMQLTPGEFGQVINSHCRLDLIHSSTQRVSSASRALSTSLQTAENLQAEAEKELSELEWTIPARDALNAASLSKKKYEQLQQKWEQTDSTRKDLERERDRFSHLYARVMEMQERMAALRTASEEARRIHKSYETVEEVLNQLAQIKRETKHASRVVLLKTRVIEIREKQDRAKALASIIENMRELLNSLDYCSKSLLIAKKKRADALQEIKDVRKALPEVCPTCGQPLTVGDNHEQDSLRGRSSLSTGQADMPKRKQ